MEKVEQSITATDKRQILENAASWVVVLGLLIYGAAKVVQFDGAANIDKLVSELTGMELMWAFYGYSKPFVLIIGFLEILAGGLVFFKKTRILGCFLATTILVNIILQDFFYGVHLGALKAALIYQSIVFFILWQNRAKVFASIQLLMKVENTVEDKRKWGLKILLTVLLFVLFRIGEYFLTILW